MCRFMCIRAGNRICKLFEGILREATGCWWVQHLWLLLLPFSMYISPVVIQTPAAVTRAGVL
jgi:hypothetical protein